MDITAKVTKSNLRRQAVAGLRSLTGREVGTVWHISGSPSG